MAARRRGARNRTRHRPDRATQLRGVARGVEGSGSPARLDHDRRAARSRNESVALQEPPARGCGAARDLRHHDPALDDPGEQSLVTRRIEAVNSSGQEGHRRARTGERRAMGDAVDAVCGTRDNREPAVHQTGRGLDGDVFAVPGGRARPHDGDRAAEAPEEGPVSAGPEGVRCVVPQLIDAAGPVGIVGNEQRDAEPGRLSEREQHRRHRHAGAPALHRLREFGGLEAVVAHGGQRGEKRPQLDRLARRHRRRGHRGDCPFRAEHRNQPPRVAITRLGDAGPGRPGEPFRERVTVERRVVGAERADQRADHGFGEAEDCHGNSFVSLGGVERSHRAAFLR